MPWLASWAGRVARPLAWLAMVLLVLVAGMQEGRDRGYWSSYRWVGAGSGTLEADIIDTLNGIRALSVRLADWAGLFPADATIVSLVPFASMSVSGAATSPRSSQVPKWIWTG